MNVYVNVFVNGTASRTEKSASTHYREAKRHRMPLSYRSLSAKEPLIIGRFCGLQDRASV